MTPRLLDISPPAISHDEAFLTLGLIQDAAPVGGAVLLCSGGSGAGLTNYRNRRMSDGEYTHL